VYDKLEQSGYLKLKWLRRLKYEKFGKGRNINSLRSSSAKISATDIRKLRKSALKNGVSIVFCFAYSLGRIPDGLQKQCGTDD
jgi:hypothetical protein